MKTAHIALVLLLALVVPAAAQTPDLGCTSMPSFLQPLFSGVSTSTVTFSCPQPNRPPAVSTAHVIRVDLATRGLAFETSGAPAGTSARAGEPAIFDQEIPTSFLHRTRSQVAFNANLFTNCCCYDVARKTHLIGLEISGGRMLSPVMAKPPPLDRTNCGLTPAAGYPFDHSLLVIGNALRIEGFADVQVIPHADAAVTGSHVLVAGGRNVAPQQSDSSGFFNPTARTLVGLGPDNGVLWIAAVDAASTSQGVTLPQGAQLMMQLGAVSAINFDGGGSTSLAIEGSDGMPRLLNVPKDGASSCTFPTGATEHCERYVGTSFAIHAPPLSPSAR